MKEVTILCKLGFVKLILFMIELDEIPVPFEKLPLKIGRMTVVQTTNLDTENRFNFFK